MPTKKNDKTRKTIKQHHMKGGSQPSLHLTPLVDSVKQNQVRRAPSFGSRQPSTLLGSFGSTEYLGPSVLEQRKSSVLTFFQPTVVLLPPENMNHPKTRMSDSGSTSFGDMNQTSIQSDNQPSLNLLMHHNAHICTSSLEEFADTLTCYLTGNGKNFVKVCKQVPNETSVENRWNFVLCQLERCIYSRYTDMSCSRNAKKLEDFIMKLNAYADDLVNDPDKYYEFFSKPSDRNNPIFKQINELVCHTTALTHVGAVYALIKLYMILRQLRELTTGKSMIDLSTLKICYIMYTDTTDMKPNSSVDIKCAQNSSSITSSVCGESCDSGNKSTGNSKGKSTGSSKGNAANYTSKFMFADILKNLVKPPTSKNQDVVSIVNRQLFSIAQKVNHLYSGRHVFSVYLFGKKIVDTYNNVFVPIIYDRDNQPITVNGNNLRSYVNHFDNNVYSDCSQRKGKSNKPLKKEPTHHIMHYNGSNAYLFRCDEYFGNSVHAQIKGLRQQYSGEKKGKRSRTTCIVQTPIQPSSNAYKNRLCKDPLTSNVIYQYIDLFSDETKKRLYDYIYRNENGEMSNLGIYYILVNIYGQTNNRERLLILSNKANANNGNKTNLKALFPVTPNIKKSLPNFTKETLQKIQSKPYGLP